MKKTLYVSDLDGTLLDDTSQVSPQSVAMLNRAIDHHGALFTCATARTPATIVKLMEKVHIHLPMIVMAGAAMWNNSSRSYDHVSAIPESVVLQLLNTYSRHAVHPFVYRRCGNAIEAFHSSTMSEAESEFMRARCGTPYKRFVLTEDCSYGNEEEAMLVFSIDRYDRLLAIYRDIVANIHCTPVCYRDIFDESMGILEVYAESTTKASAIHSLAQEIGADRIVVFGDNRNDMPMMRIADVSVAVANAFPEVKALADVVIEPNTSRSVAQWILHDAEAIYQGRQALND